MIEKKPKIKTNLLLVYKEDLLVGNVSIEISGLCYHIPNNNEQNTLNAIVTEKQNREVDLLAPEKLFFHTKDRKSAETLEIEFAKRKNLFPTVTLKFRKKGIDKKFPFYVARDCSKKRIQN